ncbi:MAG: Flp pilus assembly protein CpaB [Deltaproteobacteria bacterium]|nr:Flp pilus assembly protein CpaB [Deltaproteobacteria bacterium]
MATRFGGASPTYAYSVRMRYLVGCLALIILVLLATLFFLLNREPAAVVAPVDTQSFNANTGTGAPKAEVLAALQRIEEGTPLDKSLFTYVSLDSEQLPEGAVLWREADMVLPNRFAAKLIGANMPVTRDSITDVRPLTSLKIPPGFRAVTIIVDARTGVEGWAKPNTRVDVLCTYTDPKDNKRKVGTVVRFVKILSVSGQTQTGTEGRSNMGGGATTVTLLVEERNAKKVELARRLGEISLALVGDVEPSGAKENSDVVTEKDIFQNEVDETVAEEPAEGSMIMTDPKNGRPVKMLLRGGRWVKAEE